MKNNLNKLGIIFVIIILVISILYFVVVYALENFNKEEYIEIDVGEITVSDNIVNDYSKFFTVQKLISEIINSMYDGDYNKVYDIISTKQKSELNKEEYINKLKNYYENNFKYEYNEENYLVGYDYENNLDMLYKDGKIYIAKVYTLNGESITLGLNLFNDTYKIIYLEI